MSNQDIEIAIALKGDASRIAELQEFIAEGSNTREVRKAVFSQTGLSGLPVSRNSNHLERVIGFNIGLETGL